MSDTACVVNLDARGTRQRLLGGLVTVAVGLALGAYAAIESAGWLAWLAAVGLLCFGTLALLQAQAKT
ncbi:MAG: hypothetical protein ACKOCB_02030 [Planctomycetia bacterium]